MSEYERGSVMIVPQVAIDHTAGHAIGIHGDTAPLREEDRLFELVRPLGTLAPVLLRASKATSEMIESVKHLMRRFECWVAFDQPPDRDSVVRWLDAGARKFAVPADQHHLWIEAGLSAQQLASTTEIESLSDFDDHRVEASPAENSPAYVLPAAHIHSIEEWSNHFCDRLHSERPDGLWPTIVVDEFGVALGLVYSSRQSVLRSVEQGKGVFWSRSRNELWEKGATSGATCQLLRITSDCDEDALRFTVQQAAPGFCHRKTRTCFGPWQDLSAIREWIGARGRQGSGYTARLLEDPELLRAKLVEEAAELADAATPEEAVWETADVFYFAMVAMEREQVRFADVLRELDRRTRQITRRPGDAKPPRPG